MQQLDLLTCSDEDLLMEYVICNEPELLLLDSILRESFGASV